VALTRARPAPAASELRIAVGRSSVMRVLTTVSVAIIVCSALESFGRIVLHLNGPVHVMWRIFDLDREGNVPSWFSGLLHLANAVVLAIITVLTRRTHRPYWRHWAGLAGMFLFFSLDEVAAFHEDVGNKLRDMAHGSGYLQNVWVFPALLLVGVVALLYRSWARHLPRHTRGRLVLAAILFVGGATVMDFFGGEIEDTRGTDNFSYVTEYHIEETMEMGGTLLALAALLAYREETWPGASIALDDTVA
jgi:hypothetical protein